MRNTLIVITAFLLMISSARAEYDWKPFEKVDAPAKVPTGYQVKGCQYYYVKDRRVYPVCKKVTGERWWWFDVTPHNG